MGSGCLRIVDEEIIHPEFFFALVAYSHCIGLETEVILCRIILTAVQGTEKYIKTSCPIPVPVVKNGLASHRLLELFPVELSWIRQLIPTTLHCYLSHVLRMAVAKSNIMRNLISL